MFRDYAKAGSPGCALAIYRDGAIIYEKGHGLASIEHGVPITPRTVFDIGSTSKQFTAASVLLLEKQGRLSIDDDVRQYIPELPDYGETIAILHLLNHTSGLRDYLDLMWLAGASFDSVTTDDDALQIVARQKALNFAPGSDWFYSNTGYFLLSVIVRRVSGKTLREFASENIFAPLQMTHTQFRDDHTALIADRALAYVPNEQTGGYALDVSYFEQTGDGAVHTSVEDLQKWDENFYTGQVGGAAMLAALQEQGTLKSGKVLDYAKGLVIAEYRGLRTVSHGGAWGGYRAEYLRFPDQHFSVACLCNRGDANPSEMARQIADIYLGSLMQPAPAAAAGQGGPSAATPTDEAVGNYAPRAPALNAFAGDYASDELAVCFRLGVVEDKLTLLAVLDPAGLGRSGGLPHNGLRPMMKDKFEIDGTSVILHFARNSDDAVTGFTLDTGRVRGIIFKRHGMAEKR